MNFTWIPFYREAARALLSYKERQSDLINFLDGLRAKGLTITSLQDRDEAGQPFLLKEIDPFTFFGVFNRGLTQENRIRILEEVKTFLELTSAVPTDFAGIPILNNQKSWFFAFSFRRKADDVPALWAVFELAQQADPLNTKAFGAAFDRALAVRNVNVNLTMGLFWIRPDVFLGVDSVMRAYAGIRLPPGGLDFASYVEILQEAKRRFGSDFPGLSHRAWQAAQAGGAHSDVERSGATTRQIDPSIDYWLVGAYWDDREPADQTESFVREGIWQNGYTDKLLDLVRQMKVGDRIAIKAASTQKEGLPFDGRGRTVSRNLIKATGTITRNHGDGRLVDVEWDPLPPEPRNWYFYTGRATVWRLRKEDDYAQRLIRFAFYGEKQDYDFFARKWWDEGDAREAEADVTANGAQPIAPVASAPPYSIDTAISEGVFLSRVELELALSRLETKRNIVLQGPPGVGKTFVAQKLACALMQAADFKRLTVVQFHPSFSYEDFVRGYRPTKEAGKFELVDGPFLRACQAAEAQPDLRHVLIVDEINRGNTSQVFGELLMLLEADKRGMRPGVAMLYRRSDAERFSIPSNLFVIGTMNRADRSLAMVDYALRRRFAFVALTPRFSDPSFRKWLNERGMADSLVQHIIGRMNSLNATIAEDRQLGPDFSVGHSFFCPRGDDFSHLGMEWYRAVVETEIVPLLDEYWYDAPDKVKSATSALLVG